MTQPYAVTVTVILYTEAETEAHAADQIEDELGAILPGRAIWRVEEIVSEYAPPTDTERAVLRGMLP